MPMYEYQCNNCGHRLDALQKISEPMLTECPVCKQSALQRLVSSVGFQLKGSGWYVTDFKNKDKTEPKKESTTSTSSDQPKKETKEASKAQSSTNDGGTST